MTEAAVTGPSLGKGGMRKGSCPSKSSLPWARLIYPRTRHPKMPASSLLHLAWLCTIPPALTTKSKHVSWCPHLGGIELGLWAWLLSPLPIALIGVEVLVAWQITDIHFKPTGVGCFSPLLFFFFFPFSDYLRWSKEPNFKINPSFQITFHVCCSYQQYFLLFP